MLTEEHKSYSFKTPTDILGSNRNLSCFTEATLLYSVFSWFRTMRLGCCLCGYFLQSMNINTPVSGLMPTSNWILNWKITLSLFVFLQGLLTSHFFSRKSEWYFIRSCIQYCGCKGRCPAGRLLFVMRAEVLLVPSQAEPILCFGGTVHILYLA